MNGPVVATEDGVARLVGILKQATPEQKDMIRDVIGESGLIKKKRRRGSTQDARMFVTRFGDAVHPEGFEVAPPSNIYDKGPAAVRLWRSRREENMGTSQADIDAMVMAAKE